MPAAATPTRRTKSKSPARKASARPKRKTRLCDLVDKHDLYQRAVQCVEAEIDFVDTEFTRLRSRTATRLREDFCGTGNTSCEWVRRRPTNVAVALDLDPVPLTWGQKHWVPLLKASQRERLELRLGNVLDRHEDHDSVFDILLAMNFSYWCFKTRAALRHYFECAHRALTNDGVMFLDYYGGSDAYKLLTEKRKIPLASRGEPALSEYKGPFVYQWHQESYNPVTSEMQAAISFVLPDGSRVKRAFTYSWRLWTIAEVRELLHEAGFKRTTAYWEGDDGKGGGNGEFTPSEVGECCPAYIGYISAEK